LLDQFLAQDGPDAHLHIRDPATAMDGPQFDIEVAKHFENAGAMFDVS
jgi:hypothetical protein